MQFSMYAIKGLSCATHTLKLYRLNISEIDFGNQSVPYVLKYLNELGHVHRKEINVHLIK